MGRHSAPHSRWLCLALLLCLLALLGDLRGPACAFCLGFLLRGVALGVGLVLLGLAFAVQIIATGHRARDFLGLTLSALGDALDGFLGTAVVLRHCEIPPSESVREVLVPFRTG